MADETFAEQMLAKFEALLLAYQAEIESASVDGRTVKMRNPTQDYRFWKAVVDAETNGVARTVSLRNF